MDKAQTERTKEEDENSFEDRIQIIGAMMRNDPEQDEAHEPEQELRAKEKDDKERRF